jgi:hypothetical protein
MKKNEKIAWMQEQLALLHTEIKEKLGDELRRINRIVRMDELPDTPFHSCVKEHVNSIFLDDGDIIIATSLKNPIQKIKSLESCIGDGDITCNGMIILLNSLMNIN